MPEVGETSKRPRRIACREVAGKGRGIFALEPIAEGEVFEQAPVIVLPQADTCLIDETLLSDYYFTWVDAPDESLRICAVVLGYGMLYNHSYRPNAFFRRSFLAREMEYIALRDIAEGEEICINYNGKPDDRKPVWFEMAPSRE
jgi:SET domain-containing protein